MTDHKDGSTCQNDNDCFGTEILSCISGFCTPCALETFGGPYPCRMYGAPCSEDFDCSGTDRYLMCTSFNGEQVCRCQRGYVFDAYAVRCQPTDDRYYSFPGGKFDPVRDFIIPGIIVMTLGAMIYLGVKLFCNCGKLWRTRHRNAAPPHIDDPHHLQQTPLVSFHRGFSSLNEVSMYDRSPPLYCPGVMSPHYLLPPASGPDIYLTTPGPAMAAVVASPPPYEEALKHKIILSSCTADTAECTNSCQLLTQPVSVHLPLERNSHNI